MTWNLDKYYGLMRSEYVVHSAMTAPSFIADNTTTTGSGGISTPTIMTAPGNSISLTTGATEGTTKLTLPPRFGQQSGSMKAVMVEVTGIGFEGLRPTFKVHLEQQASSNPREFGILLDEQGGHVRAKTSTDETLSAAMISNILEIENGAVGFLMEFSEGTSADLYGHVAHSESGLHLPAAGGTYRVVLSNETKDSPNYKDHSVSFKQVKLTLVWNFPGDTQTRVF